MKNTETSPESQKLHVPLMERIKSIPETFGIRVNEEPEYKVLKKDGDFEVRRYEKQLIAKVTLSGMTFDDFREAAFEKLANYIFEGNAKDKSIPMTSPVMEQHGDGKQVAMTSAVYQEETEAGTWTMSFILPKEYSLGNAPKPTSGEITLEEVQPYEVACVSYTGNNTLEKVKEHERKLAGWLVNQAKLTPNGKYIVAQYDAPFVIPFLKRNEIQVKIDKIH